MKLRRDDWLRKSECLPHWDGRDIGGTKTPGKSFESSDKGLARISSDNQRNRFSFKMARTKSLTKKTEKATEAPLTTKATNGTPYQLDPSQVERAAKALVAHMRKHAEEKQAEAPKKNLADDEDEAEDHDQPIFLSLSTKKQVSNTKSLKPVAM